MAESRQIFSLARGFGFLTVFLLVMLLGVVLRLWAGLLSADYPLEYRENAMILTTALMREGRNPFAVEEQPAFTNGYGFFYHWLVYPVALLSRADFTVHRIASDLCLAGCCVLLFWILRKDGVPILVAASAAVVLLVNLAFDVSSLARPDGLGLLLMLACLIVPYGARFAPGSLVAAALLALAAFYTKPYFLFGLGCLGSYLLLFVNVRSAFVFGSAFLVGMVVTAPAVRALYPCYFTNVIYAQWGVIHCDWRHLALHGGRFALLNAGLILILALTCVGKKQQKKGEVGSASSETEANREERVGLGLTWIWKAPIIRRTLWTYPGHLLLLGTVSVLWMGQHIGQGLLYYRQLLLPFLIWLCALRIVRRLAAGQRAVQFSVGILLLGQLSLLLAYGLDKGPRLWKDHTREWAEIHRLLVSCGQVYHDAPLAHLMFREGRTVYDNGHTYLALLVRPGPAFWVPPGYSESTYSYLRKGALALANREFDLLALTSLNDGFFDALSVAGTGYRLTKKLPLPLPFNSEAIRLSIYEPAVNRP
ncbi:MAG: hypothetical protein ACUVWX_10045 [Kiritimatiellia bacterium]